MLLLVGNCSMLLLLLAYCLKLSPCILYPICMNLLRVTVLFSMMLHIDASPSRCMTLAAQA